MRIPPFNVISRRPIPEIALTRKNLFSKFCKQGGKLDYSRYSQIYFLPYVITGNLLATHFRNGDCQRSLSLSTILYILSFNWTVAYH